VTRTMSADLICAVDPVYCQPAARYGQTEACKVRIWFCLPSSFSRGPGDVLGLPAASADIVAKLLFGRGLTRRGFFGNREEACDRSLVDVLLRNPRFNLRPLSRDGLLLFARDLESRRCNRIKEGPLSGCRGGRGYRNSHAVAALTTQLT